MDFDDIANYPVSRVAKEKIVSVEQAGDLVSLYTEKNLSPMGKYIGPLEIELAFLETQNVSLDDLVGATVTLEYRQHPSGKGAEWGSVTKITKGE